jgi:outer membrane biosynthesis protein TonB
MMPDTPQVAVSSTSHSMLMILFLFAGFFIAMIWFRRFPSMKSVAIGGFLMALVAVPLVLLAVVFLYFGRWTPARGHNVTIDMTRDGAITYHNGIEFSETGVAPIQLDVPPEIITPAAPCPPEPVIKPQTPTTPKKSSEKPKPAEKSSAEEKNSAEKPADAVKLAETSAAKPVEAESTAPPKKSSEPAAPTNPRPAWVDAPAKLSNGIYRTKVTVGPFATREECDRALPAELLKATNNYIDSYLGEGANQWVHLPPGYYLGQGIRRGIPLPPGYANGPGIFRDQWQEDVLASFGPMIQVHTLLEFNEETRHDLQQRWLAGRAENRLGFAGLGAGLILALLGTMFGYLKIDTATRGYYTRRLQFVAVLAILTTLVLGLQLGRHWYSGFGF